MSIVFSFVTSVSYLHLNSFVLYDFSMVYARNFHLGAMSLSGVQVRSPGRSLGDFVPRTETAHRPRHCLQVLTAKTIKL